MPICFQGVLYPQSHVQILPTCAFLSCSFGTTNRGGTPASAGRTKTSGFYDQIPVTKTTTPMHRIAVPRNEAQKTKGMEWNHKSRSLESIISILASVLPLRAESFGFTGFRLRRILGSPWARDKMLLTLRRVQLRNQDWSGFWLVGWLCHRSKISNAVPERGPDGVDSPVDSSKAFLHWKSLKSCDDPIMINIARSSMTPESLPTARFFVSHCTRRPKTSLQGWWMASAQWNSNGSIENKSESGISMKLWFVFLCEKQIHPRKRVNRSMQGSPQRWTTVSSPHWIVFALRAVLLGGRM